ncbi:MAG TPA: YdeI/OmpD-associated family protein [Anaerolineae bacterium]
MSPASGTSELLELDGRAAWRQWLAENHAGSTGVWLTIRKKGSGKTGLSYEDAVEEALCFGWIDGQINTLDGERYRQRFTPRRSGSTWAESNKQRVEKLIAQGLMQPAGLAQVAAAKADGRWHALDDLELLRVPPDLEAALDAAPGAAAYFASLSASTRKMLLYWLASAKRPETRQKRLEQIVAAAAHGRTPF